MKSLFYNINFLFILALIVILPSCNKTRQVEEPQGPAVIAYVEGEKALDASKIDANKVTHINYAFAHIKDGKAYLADETTDVGNIKKLLELKANNPKLKILISVAAREWSKGFAVSPLTDETVKAFANSVTEIIKANDLDGIDINWGYPVATNTKDTVNSNGLSINLAKLTTALRENLTALEGETEKAYKLSYAVGTDSTYIANAGFSKIQQQLDFLNVIAYDNQDDKIAIHQSSLYPSDKYKIRKAASVTIQEYIKSGVSPQKLILGIPFYGKVYKVKKNSQTGIGDPVVEKAGIKGFTFIKDSLINQKEYYRYWDNEAQAPYVYNFYNSTLVTYDDEDAVEAKCRYAKDNNLGGIMFWEYGSDPKEYLLDVINKALR